MLTAAAVAAGRGGFAVKQEEAVGARAGMSWVNAPPTTMLTAAAVSAGRGGFEVKQEAAGARAGADVWYAAGAAAGGSVGGRMQHLRKKKAVQRKRTRDLYYALDPLVPVRSRPPMAEKGCLPSRRTFLQLQDDCRDYLHGLKHRCDVAAPTRRPAVAAHGAREGGAAKDRRAVSADLMREAMLNSTQLLLLEVNTKSWMVQRVSQGLRLLFANHPRVPGTVEGECLLHYIRVSHTSALRDACRDPASNGGDAAVQDLTTADLTIGLRTFGDGFMSIRQCRVQRVASHLPEQELFLLTALADVPRCITQDRGWSVEKMRDLCGIYEYDATAPLADTLRPWQVEALIDTIENSEGGANWQGLFIGAMRTNDMAAAVLQKYTGLAPALWTSWSEAAKKFLFSMLQIHVTFDMKAGCNGIRCLRFGGWGFEFGVWVWYPLPVTAFRVCISLSCVCL
jgi:hypothetical protein